MTGKAMTGADALRAAIPRLRAAGIEEAPRDARLLLAHALHIAPDRVTLHTGDVLSETQEAAFDAAIAARAARQPLSQITGQRLFWGRRFRVTRETLDPRPETARPAAAKAFWGVTWLPQPGRLRPATPLRRCFRSYESRAFPVALSASFQIASAASASVVIRAGLD